MDSAVQEDQRKKPALSFDEFPPPTYEGWKAEAEAALKGAPFEKRLLTPTYEEITLEPLYTADHIKGLPLEGRPGERPFLRGTRPSGYLAEPWAVAQGCDEPLPEEANAVIRRELEKGSSVLHFSLDEATRRGEDWDGKRGLTGLSLSTLADLDGAFDGLDLTSRPLRIDGGFSVVPLLALIAAQARAQGRQKALSDYSGSVGADPLGTLARDGSLPCPLDELYDEMALSLHWTAARAPKVKTILIGGDVYHDGGASATEEIACVAATAIAYVRAMEIRGFSLESIASAMTVSLSLGANFFMEIAKIRAMRQVWSHIMEAFGGDEKACRIDLSARTSRFTQTVYDPYVNILRATSQAFSGVVGGVDAMEVARFDEAIRSGSEQSRRIARNIQIMLQNEFDLLQPVDPGGGSWYIETLTDQVARKAWKEMQEIEERGGLFRALQEGAVQKKIGATLKQRWKKLANRADRAVGTNMYANVTEKPLTEERDMAAIAARRREAVEAFRADIDAEHCRRSLEAIPPTPGEPLAFMETLAEAFFAGATLGEVRKRLDDGFEGTVAVEPLTPRRWTEPFEALRRRTEEAAAEGRPIRVFLANMGPIPQHKARADFSTGFMEVARFEVLRNDGFADTEEAARAAVESGADVTIICSTDETYPDIVPPLARAIKEARPEAIVLLAGAPAPEHKEAYVEAGVDDFIHVRADCLKILTDIQKARGLL
ncbi:acyl-CoA mutase large subunit family protein [Aminithiophilus ramosus]|uniref:Acyl-CoA mutase large subunit family protein n=2 Tax=Synergistales TaxID=649776 RepID=A0A9Q7EZ55_9BACT|nr:methylmalonyl-CoA mutase family protein [Aminithiophilus ramosus]QTX31842.1 acyl-CoA mutase large subunit family protein [Aminithiophilus ramosus]QVL35665.1 acyl-CoA mutase large subunit family protein [Synergistota bacterium]